MLLRCQCEAIHDIYPISPSFAEGYHAMGISSDNGFLCCIKQVPKRLVRFPHLNSETVSL
uniref:Uncharacterized protein n=1 Tax=Oryza sativa subsp. japonica TaxID=39947 RepID=Q6Z416_ORYSJ|nr:hypothetical protein [Oryza sativa Japonica Group]